MENFSPKSTKIYNNIVVIYIYYIIIDIVIHYPPYSLYSSSILLLVLSFTCPILSSWNINHRVMRYLGGWVQEALTVGFVYFPIGNGFFPVFLYRSKANLFRKGLGIIKLHCPNLAAIQSAILCYWHPACATLRCKPFGFLQTIFQYPLVQGKCSEVVFRCRPKHSLFRLLKGVKKEAALLTTFKKRTGGISFFEGGFRKILSPPPVLYYKVVGAMI